MEVALLYKNRWLVEFFKWIKQHLKIKSFWGTSENAAQYANQEIPSPIQMVFILDLDNPFLMACIRSIHLCLLQHFLQCVFQKMVEKILKKSQV